MEYKYIFTEWRNVLLGKAPGFCYLIRLVLKMLEIVIAILSCLMFVPQFKIFIVCQTQDFQQQMLSVNEWESK